MDELCSRTSILFKNPIAIRSWASVAGKKEAEGPLCNYFDQVSNDTLFGQKSWEQAESKMQELALRHLLKKSNCQQEDIDVIFSGDLLNQCIGSTFCIRNQTIPQLGLYGACSTMAEGLIAAAIAADSGHARLAVAMTSSHFAASERQYRFPLGYGGQRPPTSQWTVTGAGAIMLDSKFHGPRIEACTIGSVADLGIRDANNMGAAMAPAALQTIISHIRNLSMSIADYDLIVTGDLGKLGRSLVISMGDEHGIDLQNNLVDCGMLVYDLSSQDVHCGGSGCGCSAIVLCAKLLPQLQSGQYKRILFCGTGALLSPTSIQQKLPIPAICHAVSIIGG